VYLIVVRHVPCSNSSFDDALLALVEETELRPLVGVYDGENASDALPDIVDAGELGLGTASDLASPQADQLP
jgi:hypothetical protein